MLSLGLGAAIPALALAASPLPPPADQQLARDMLQTLVEIIHYARPRVDGSRQSHPELAVERGLCGGRCRVAGARRPPDEGQCRGALSRQALARARIVLGPPRCGRRQPEDWSVDPFKLTERDGWFYGRGTIDMKDGDAALVESLIRLKREKFIPARDVIVAFTADEEAGGDANGPAFLLKEHRDLIDATLVVNLDGGGGDTKNGERQFFRSGDQREDLRDLHAGDHQPRRTRLSARSRQRDL
jgi:hypothetical protein